MLISFQDGVKDEENEDDVYVYALYVSSVFLQTIAVPARSKRRQLVPVSSMHTKRHAY